MLNSPVVCYWSKSGRYLVLQGGSSNQRQILGDLWVLDMAFAAFDPECNTAKEHGSATSSRMFANPSASLAAVAGSVASIADPYLRGLFQQYGGLMQQVTEYMEGDRDSEDEEEEDNDDDEGGDLTAVQKNALIRLLGMMVSYCYLIYVCISLWVLILIMTLLIS